jgi:RHS repeat-associated protein
MLDPGACPTGSNPHAYIYNAENQLTSTAGITYTYDGDGKRVSKSNGKLYWYGMGSDALDESDASGNITNEYVFFGGKRIARRDSSGNVNYYFADHLGTARVVTNATGTILDDSDFYPFGGERSYVSGSGNTYKFTGKERDSESGLDSLGARFHSSNLGRFVSADPVMASRSHIADPQRWNQYAYVSNNPLTRMDTAGRFWDPWQHVDLTNRAYAAAHMQVNNNVVTANRNRDGGGGHNPYTAPVIHPSTWHHEQYSAGTQANHFLRDRNDSQHQAYQNGVNALRADANAVRAAQLGGDTNAADTRMGDAQHLIQDSFAHTTRENGNGAITHIQCFNCSGAADDHHHPDFEANGQLTNEAQGSVDTSAAFLIMMQNSRTVSDDQFSQALENFVAQYFTQALPDDPVQPDPRR